MMNLYSTIDKTKTLINNSADMGFITKLLSSFVRVLMQLNFLLTICRKYVILMSNDFVFCLFKNLYLNFETNPAKQIPQFIQK